MSEYFGAPVNKIFDQYLRTTQIPVLEYYINTKESKLYYRYANCVEGFNLPIFLKTERGGIILGPESQKWNSSNLRQYNATNFPFAEIEKNYYLTLKKVEQPTE